MAETDELMSGSMWRHKNGNHYQIILLTNMKSERPDEYPPTVVYRRMTDGAIWSRPISRWHGSFTRVQTETGV